MVMSLDFILQEVVPQQAIQWDVIQFGISYGRVCHTRVPVMVRYPEAGGETTHAAGMGGSSELRESGSSVRDRWHVEMRKRSNDGGKTRNYIYKPPNHHRLCLELDQSVTTARGHRKVSDDWDNLHYTYARIEVDAKIVFSLMVCLRA